MCMCVCESACVCVCVRACVCVCLCVQIGLFQPLGAVCIINPAPLHAVLAQHSHNAHTVLIQWEGVPFAGYCEAAGGTSWCTERQIIVFSTMGLLFPDHPKNQADWS